MYNLISSSTMNYFDYIIIAILALFFLVGVLKGTVKSLIGLISFFVTAIVTLFVFRYIGDLCLQMGFVKNLIYGKDNSLYSLFNSIIKLPNNIGTIIITDSSANMLDTVLNNIGAPFNILLKPILKTLFENKSLVGYSIQKSICISLALYMYLIIVFIVTFIVIRIVIKIIDICLIRYKSHFNLSNVIFGGLIGAIRGICVLILISICLNFSMAWNFMKPFKDSYNESPTASYLSKVSTNVMNEIYKIVNIDTNIDNWLKNVKDTVSSYK